MGDPEFTLTLDGESLTLGDLHAFLAAERWRIDVAPHALARVRTTSALVHQWLAAGKPVYGLTRGLGPLKDHVLSPEEALAFQSRILESHATSIGEPFCDAIARLALLLRANVASQGRFGVRPELIQRLLDVLNAGVVPLMPWQGPLGNGDVQPMAALGLAVTGNPHGRARYADTAGPAPEVLAAAGLEPVFELRAQEALAIISGSTVMAAGTVYAVHRVGRLLAILDAAFALTLEAMRAEIAALDPRIHASRRIPGQVESARIVRHLLRGSGWTTPEGRARLGESRARVQDAVSLRSTPHVHGSLREFHSFVSAAMERELNASTMNPLIFGGEGEDGPAEALMGGNYDGSHMAHLLDSLNFAVTDAAGIAQTRSSRMTAPGTSYGLPPNLVGGAAGLNTGMLEVRALQVWISGQMRQQAASASVHALTTPDLQEDYIIMGGSSLHALQCNLDMLEQVVAIELLLAAQAIDLIRDRMAPLALGRGTGAVHACIRRHVAPMDEDRFQRDDVDALTALVRSPELAGVVEQQLGSV